MRFFRKEEPVTKILDLVPHSDATMLNGVFTNNLDPRIRFFLDHIGADNLRLLLTLRDSALRGTGLGFAGMVPGKYTISERRDYKDDYGIDQVNYYDKHALSVMINIFFSSVHRWADSKEDPLLRQQPIMHIENTDKISKLYPLLFAFSAVLIYKYAPKNDMPGFLFCLVTLAFVIFAAHVCSAQREKYMKSLKAEFNDTRYDELLNQLCRNENVESIDWSHEIKVNGKFCSVRTLMLILLTSFNDKMYSKIFSELLPKLMNGEKFDVHDETSLSNFLCDQRFDMRYVHPEETISFDEFFTRELVIHVDPNPRQDRAYDFRRVCSMQ